MDCKISILKIVHDTIVDGYGFRTSIYCAGCSHHCFNCHNKDSWNVNNGIFMSINEIFKEIKENTLTNVTFTGGDPMFQAKEFLELAKLIKNNSNKTIWCYTGYTFEEILESQEYKKDLLNFIDILVDGEYIDKLKDVTLSFRGSSNQRIIDVQKSLKENKIILWENDNVF